MAVILALDTSTEACSCALSVDAVIHESHVIAPRQHAQLLLPMIRDLLASLSLDFSSLDAIAFGCGPGSFTGLRIAAGVTQGIAFGANIPVIPVSTLAAIALEASRTTDASTVLACLDARIDEVYWGLFRTERGLPEAIGQEMLCKPEAMQVGDRILPERIAAGGNGLVYKQRFPEALQIRLGTCLPLLLPRAGHIATIAVSLFSRQAFVTAEEAAPVYLRDKVTHQKSHASEKKTP